MKNRFILILIFCLGFFSVEGKTKKFGTWVELEFSKELLKKFEVSLISEFRFQDNLTVDEYMFDGKLSYEPVKFLNFAAIYRVNTDVKNSGNVTLGRFAFDANAKKEFGRFDASVRARYTNYFELDEGDPDKKYFRPRVKLEYDIQGNKILPYISYELFRNTTDKEFDKSRFDIGGTRKVGKIGRIGLYYRLQNYFNDKSSIHILGINYRLKF